MKTKAFLFVCLASIVMAQAQAPITPVVGAISDIHVGRKGWEEKVNKTLNILVNHTPALDAIFIAGDITNNGKQTEFDQLKTTIADKVPAHIPVYYCMGNHDWWDNETECGERFVKTLGQDLNQIVDVKGYPFILISMETKQQASAYLAKTREFLANALASTAKKYPGKPIFLFLHIPNTNTVYGSYEINGKDSWGTFGVKDICERYPQLIAVSGHSHYPLADERSIHQDKFTSINDGSIAYTELENGFEGGSRPKDCETILEGCVVSINKTGDVLVKRMDFFRNEEIKKPWIIQAPHDGSRFAYKNRTGGENPYFTEQARITISNIKATNCRIEFDQAIDDQDVHQYRIDLLDADMDLLPAPTYRILAPYYMNSGKPTTPITFDIKGLSPNTVYRVRVTGFDSFGNATLKPLIKELKVKNGELR